MPRLIDLHSYRRYSSTKHHAKIADVEFNFTYLDWVRWWESKLGPEWERKHGRKTGQYCMVRKNGEGAIEDGNVLCVLQRKVKAEFAGKPRKILDVSPLAKLRRNEVREIFLAPGWASQIGKFYGVSGATVRRIKKRRTWVHVTNDLPDNIRSSSYR